MNAQNIIITGSHGFIGSNLCHKIIKQSPTIHIYAIDNLISGNIKNISNQCKNITFIQHNINTIFKSSNPTLQKIINKEIQIHQIYHLACPASPVDYQNDPIGTLNTCFIGSQNMLKIANIHNARILFTSTSEVYGDPLEHPQKESYWGNVNPIGPRSQYDCGKRCAESLFFNYHRTIGTNIRVVRIFNTYGPNMRPNDGRVVSNFINQILSNNDITIYGSGEQTRSFCYVDDMTNALVTFMNQSDEIGPVNIGNPNEITIKELAELLLQLVKSESKIIYKPKAVDDPQRRKPDVTKISKYWSPKVNIENGLQQTIKYFSQFH